MTKVFMQAYNPYRAKIESLLVRADIKINGNRAHDIRVLNNDLFRRVLGGGSLAFGESYMDGWWESDALDECAARLIRIDAHRLIQSPADIRLLASAVFANRQRKRRAFEIGERHYDIGNDLYRAMLDARMTYTCGYWKNTQSLDSAQSAKLDLVCKKIGLQAGQRVLDIGCGWGSFAKFAAEQYGANVVGITVSKAQIELGRELCKGLPVELRLQDYRDVNEPFDRVVSLGMFEHVGYRNYRAFMRVADRCLTDGGLFLLHTIGGNASVKTTNAWIDQYIFPGSMLPSIAQIGRAIEKIFVMEDWHNFSADYDKTLMAWFRNFDAQWDELKKTYDDRFYRMWKFYLLSCAGSFRARSNQLWQIVLSKGGVSGGYVSIR